MEIFSAILNVSHMSKIKPDSLLAPEMSPDRVGRRLTAMRDVLRLQKSQLADSIGLDRSALTRIENGKEGLGLAKANLIADLYGYGLNYLYRGDLNDIPTEARAELLVALHAVRALPAKK